MAGIRRESEVGERGYYRQMSINGAKVPRWKSLIAKGKYADRRVAEATTLGSVRREEESKF